MKGKPCYKFLGLYNYTFPSPQTREAHAFSCSNKKNIPDKSFISSTFGLYIGDLSYALTGLLLILVHFQNLTKSTFQIMGTNLTVKTMELHKMLFPTGVTVGKLELQGGLMERADGSVCPTSCAVDYCSQTKRHCCLERHRPTGYKGM